MKYTDEEKKQLLINLDIEGPCNSLLSIPHSSPTPNPPIPSLATRSMRLVQTTLRNTIFRIQKAVRSKTMHEISEKYHGDPLLAVTGSQKEGDASARKSKAARLAVASPKKKAAPTAQRVRPAPPKPTFTTFTRSPTKLPSSSTFNPVLPPKTLILLSRNGSPLANPFSDGTAVHAGTHANTHNTHPETHTKLHLHPPRSLVHLQTPSTR
ncbi:hypothetical protein BT96DRAFT_1022290 [Gymnopus androsaceus JB14]|uniref:Borealin N-terminal domain-containing protein n=1 Tax=Gymnopus androsaceus JB14 TaxID=1447944 RepID=A0A6A4HB10_9AGAR|nr:hypothetical protein BT96DRAFT_1022290 [Gymnopus androsaceus JB14]